MALLEIEYLDYLVTAPDALDQSFVVATGHTYETEKTYVFEVKSGTIQFCMGQPVGANSPIHEAGDKIIFTILGDTHFYYKASAAGASFIVGF